MAQYSPCILNFVPFFEVEQELEIKNQNLKII